MDNRTKRLRQLMKENGWKAGKVAEMLGRQSSTVYIWCCKTDNKVIPSMALELLEMKAAAAKAAK